MLDKDHYMTSINMVCSFINIFQACLNDKTNKQTKKCHSCVHLDLVLFFCQDPDADEVKEETGTVGNCL